jgi:WD40 repeat protein
VNSVSFAADGRRLVTGSSDGTVKIWDAAMWREQATLRAGAGEIRSVALSSDGKLIAAGTRYGAILVWDMSSRRELARIEAHVGDVWAVAFTPDGKTLASGDGDWSRPGDVKLWDVDNWRARSTLKHTGEVLCLAFAPDGKTLAAGSWDKTVRLWALDIAVDRKRSGSVP